MNLLWKGVPVPTLAAVAILILSGILHIVGIATPYWHEEIVSNSIIADQTHVHFGLWVECILQTIDTFDCRTHTDLQNYVVAVRAMTVLALLLGAVCIVTTGIWAFLKIKKFQTIIMWASVITAFLAGLFGIIGIIIYAAEINTSESNSGQGQLVEEKLSWSFGLCTTSACLTVVATVLLILGTRYAE